MKYQKEYASNRSQMYDKTSRIQLKLLDVGSSTGIIDNELAKSFKHVTGIDIDKGGVQYAKKKYKRKNLKFKLDDAMNLSFKDNSFDVVICAQVYEHVPSDIKLMNEIYRVLKPGGVCYFAALNKYWIMEPHHNLPFLSWLPKTLGNLYVRVTGKSNTYYETLRPYWGLRKLTKAYQHHDYTEKILKNPQKYGYKNNFPSKGILYLIIKLFAPLLKYYTPTYFWILEKPN